MTRKRLLERLDCLQSRDPRRYPRHLDHSVWIWECDQIEAESRIIEHGAMSQAAPPRPPLGPLSMQALAGVNTSVKDVPLWIAVELAEAGYLMQRWPEYWPQGNLWGCVVSDKAGRHIPVQVRVLHEGLMLSGLPE